MHKLWHALLPRSPTAALVLPLAALVVVLLLNRADPAHPGTAFGAQLAGLSGGELKGGVSVRTSKHSYGDKVSWT